MPSATRDHGKDAKPLRGVYLLTNPRSASNLFQKMLSGQEVADSGYFFYQTGINTMFNFWEGPLSDRTEAYRDDLHQKYRSGYDSLQAFLEEAEKKGQNVLVKEHTVFLAQPRDLWSTHYPKDADYPLLSFSGKDEPHTSLTVCPDSLLESLQPIFQIRNPMLMFPSMARAARKVGYKQYMDSDPSMTVRYSRELYDWYLSNDAAAQPLVIDADDIMNDREAVRRICVQAGLDPEALMFEWPTKEETDPYKKIFLSTLATSTGILPGLDSSGLSLDAETKKWKEEFGEEDGEMLARRVKEAMPDYEYLRSRRTTSA